MSNKTNEIRQYVENLVSPLLEHPESLSVEVSEMSHSYAIELAPAKKDMGKIIGRTGSTIHAIRRLVFAFCSKVGHKTSRVNVEEVKGSQREVMTPRQVPGENG